MTDLSSQNHILAAAKHLRINTQTITFLNAFTLTHITQLLDELCSYTYQHMLKPKCFEIDIN